MPAQERSVSEMYLRRGFADARRFSHGRSRDYLCLRANLPACLFPPTSCSKRSPPCGGLFAAGRPRPVELSVLTGAQLELVRLLRREPGVSVADAAARLRVAPNTVSTLVGQLADAGVLERRDRRRRPAGRAARRSTPGVRRRVDAWRDRRVDALGEAMARLPAADRAAPGRRRAGARPPRRRAAGRGSRRMTVARRGDAAAGARVPRRSPPLRRPRRASTAST